MLYAFAQGLCNVINPKSRTTANPAIPPLVLMASSFGACRQVLLQVLRKVYQGPIGRLSG
jgi:hypothetical protein